MKNIRLIGIWLGLFIASYCYGQTFYTVKDLGKLGGYDSEAAGINASGQVVGSSPALNDEGVYVYRAFRTAPNRPINFLDNLQTLGDPDSFASGINASGQVVGYCEISGDETSGVHAFRTAPNQPINPGTDALGHFDCYPDITWAEGINDSGQVTGGSYVCNNTGADLHAFRTGPNQPINPATDDLGSLGGGDAIGAAINASGQVTGNSITSGGLNHAFRTAPNAAINPATDDLGTLGGSFSWGNAINASGQVVGWSGIGGSAKFHAFVFKNGVMLDLNNMISANSGWVLSMAAGINDAGQIAGSGTNPRGEYHAFLLTPANAPTAIAFSSNLNPSVYGQSVTFTATVHTWDGSVATGRVSFATGGGSSIGSAALDANGTASFTRSDLTASTYGLTAVYHGDANNRFSSSAEVEQSVQPTTSAATIHSSLNPSAGGQPVTFTAKIASPTVTPVGPVTFTAGKLVLGTVQLKGGVAQITTSALQSSISVKATYGGNSNVAGSTAWVTQIVRK